LFKSSVVIKDRDERLQSDTPCPGCGKTDFLSAVRGETAREIVRGELDRRTDSLRQAEEEKAEAYKAWLDQHRTRMGFSPDWKPSYNVEKNGDFVLETLPAVCADDYCWLSNQIANMISDCGFCIDNYRLCRGLVQSEDYVWRKSQGCCGFYDEQLHNPTTHHNFWLGCNYGH
jgi:hypothetical protein